jgi:hypothetical protein
MAEDLLIKRRKVSVRKKEKMAKPLYRPARWVGRAPATKMLVAKGESSGAQVIMRQHKQNIVSASLFLSNAKK